MKLSIKKSATTILITIILAFSCVIPILAAPATVDVNKQVFTNSGSIYDPALGWVDFEVNCSIRIQQVTNDNGTFFKYFANATGTAVSQETGVIYHVNQLDKEIISDPDNWSRSSNIHFVAPGPNNNLFLTLKYEVTDGQVTTNISNSEIR